MIPNSFLLRRSLLPLLLCLQTSLVQAAELLVNASFGSIGCDLIEAIESANTNTAVGGCVSGSTGLDTIRFANQFTRYELPGIAFSNFSGSAGTPEIVSQIRILGPGDKPMTIARPSSQSDLYRAFTIAFGGGELSLENLSLQNFGQSSGFSGGAIRVEGVLTMIDVELTDNSADFGGGIWVQGGRATIRSSLIHENRAINGGGIGISSSSQVSIFDTTISNNTSQSGGGISLAASPGSSLAVYNATITENSASSVGGGLSLLMSGSGGENSAVIRNTLLSGNTAPSSKEGHFANLLSPDDVDIQNNVLGYSANNYGESVNILQFLVNDNVVLTQGTNQATLRSILDSLKDNGGKTMTHALVANSPALDKGLQNSVSGTAPFLFSTPGCRGELISLGFGGDYRPDQRGVSRPAGAECDIGAYEYDPDPDPDPDTDPDTGEESCFIVKAKNNRVVTFCL